MKTLIYTLLALLCSVGVFAAENINISTVSSDGTGYTWNSPTLTITADGDYIITGSGTTTNRIVVNTGVTANITIQDVAIDVSGTSNACAFSIASGATVALTLSGTNALKSGTGKAGLAVPGGASLTITGTPTGELTATGGTGGTGIGAGIGPGTGGNVTINGGTVTAIGGTGGAGIGGNGAIVAISGGTVTATGGNFGAGIGGSLGNSGGTVAISGGTVTANGGASGAGIGGGYGGSNGGDVIISGGSISASNIQSQPTNGSGDEVYLSIFAVGSSNRDTPVTEGSVGGDDSFYGINDVKTDAGGNLYLYLPASTGDELVTFTVNGDVYGGFYTRTSTGTTTTADVIPSYDITLSQTALHDFGTETYGYTDAPTALTVTITNTGSNATGELTVALDGAGAESFELLSTPLPSLATGEPVSFTVRPNTGLSAITHEATVTVTGGNGISEEFDVSFEVNKKPITITPKAGQGKIYGHSDPKLTYADPGLIAGDELDGALSRVAGENPGTYLIEQGDLDDLTGNYDLTFTTGVLFTIDPSNVSLLQDLEDAVVCAGESYTFEIVAEGDNLSYEWYRGNSRITGANRNTCTITNAESGDSERYYVIVRSDLGSYRSSVYSKEVRLWVASQLPETLQFVEFPSTVITGNTYRIKLAGYSDVTQYLWSYNRDGVTFSPVAGSVGENETQATFGALSKGEGLLTVTLEHPCGTRQATQAVLVEYPTGVEQVAGAAVRVFPNPTAGIIKVSGTTSNQIIRIVDITGSLKGTYPAQDGETTIDLTGYPKGTYLVQYNGKTVKVVKK